MHMGVSPRDSDFKMSAGSNGGERLSESARRIAARLRYRNNGRTAIARDRFHLSLSACRDHRTGSKGGSLEESDNARSREIEDRPAVRRMPPTRIANDREPNNSDISARRYAARLLL